MKRIFAAFLMLMSVSVWAKYEEGVHYKKIPTPAPTKTPEVVEIFWLGCGHCYNLEPMVMEWKGKTDLKKVKFSRIPAMFGKPWILHAHLYYIAEELNVAEKTVPLAFNAIHVKKNRLYTKTEQRDFFVKTVGVKAEDFDKVYDSETIRKKMQSGNQLVRGFGISGVPAIIVNGEFMVDASSAGGQDKMFDVVDYLISKK